MLRGLLWVGSLELRMLPLVNWLLLTCGLATTEIQVVYKQTWLSVVEKLSWIRLPISLTLKLLEQVIVVVCCAEYQNMTDSLRTLSAASWTWTWTSADPLPDTPLEWRLSSHPYLFTIVYFWSFLHFLSNYFRRPTYTVHVVFLWAFFSNHLLPISATGRISLAQGANEPGGERARRRKSQGANKPKGERAKGRKGQKANRQRGEKAIIRS